MNEKFLCFVFQCIFELKNFIIVISNYPNEIL